MTTSDGSNAWLDEYTAARRAWSEPRLWAESGTGNPGRRDPAPFFKDSAFHLAEKINLRFRSEFFNIFNHPNFGPPDNTLTDALFGRSTQTLASGLGSGGANGGFNPLYQIGGPRSIQLALKLVF